MGESYQHAVPAKVTGPDAPTDAVKTTKTPVADGVKTNESTTPPQKAERPADIPEKFWDAEKGEVRTADLLKSYSELEKARSEKKEEPKPKEETKELSAEEKAAKEKADAEKAAQEPELPKHLQKFSTEFTEKGGLSEESYKELADKHGLSKEYVDTYIEGLQAKQNAYLNSVYAETGGDEESFNTVSQWAAENLPQAEIKALNEVLASGDKAKASLAARGLYAKFQEANGKEPNLLGDGGAPRSNVTAFKSTAEVVKAMSDPRYATDKAYRDDIDRRLEISDVI